MTEGRPVAVRVKGASEGETLEVCVPGECREQGESVWLRWRECLAEDGGLSSETEVFLQAREGHAMMRRKGPYEVRMVFDPGHDRESLYETPYGAIPVTVRAGSVRTERDGRGGTVRIGYALCIRDGEPDMRDLSVEWRWRDADGGAE